METYPQAGQRVICISWERKSFSHPLIECYNTYDLYGLEKINPSTPYTIDQVRQLAYTSFGLPPIVSFREFRNTRMEEYYFFSDRFVPVAVQFPVGLL